MRSNTVSAARNPHIQPIRRDIHFGLPAAKIGNWHQTGGEHVSIFMNTLSLFFPVGERFFIDSVRQYRDALGDPALSEAVTAFIGQEAMHGREHEDYNAAMFELVPATRDMEHTVARLLSFLQRRLPKSMRLSATIALEHFTAIMADGLLKNPALLEGADPRFAALWRWHALEETEHKSVAFDVWDAVMGRGPRAYVERTGGLVVATVIFWSLAIPFYLRALHARGLLTDGQGWRRFFSYSFTGHAFLARLVGPWADYFRPSFHPWDHDNSRYLEEVDRVLAAVRAVA